MLSVAMAASLCHTAAPMGSIEHTSPHPDTVSSTGEEHEVEPDLKACSAIPPSTESSSGGQPGALPDGHGHRADHGQVNLPTYDFVLLPPTHVAARSVHVSRQLAPLGSFILHEDAAAIPHLSLYMSTLGVQALAEAVRRLARIGTSSPTLPLVATRYAQMPDGFVEVQYAVTPELAQLQQRLLDAINPVRDGCPETTPGGMSTADAMRRATGEERCNYERWGYPECGSEFRPHISFTRLTALQCQVDLGRLPPAEEFSGVFCRLALCSMGFHGTCTGVVTEIELGGGGDATGR